MSEEYFSTHTYELDPDRWIAVEISRRWPKYVATWSIRQRAGDSDFPLASGELERMPPPEGADLEAELDTLREQARQQALNTLPSEEERRPAGKGFLSRLFGR
jgi:hypothetical protein